MKVVLDTNILISAFVFHSQHIDCVIEVASTKGNALQFSDYVIAEAQDVICRKWPHLRSEFDFYLALLDYERVNVSIEESEPQFMIRDPKDYPVLRAALESDCDVLVTGDKDFADVDVDGISIMTPREFFEVYSGDAGCSSGK